MSNGGQRIFATIFSAAMVFFAASGASQAGFGWLSGQHKTVAEQNAEKPKAAAPAHRPQIAKTETSKAGNWLVTCVDFVGGEPKRACTAKLQILQKKSHRVAFIWEIGVTREHKVISVMHVPTGILIAPGIELRLGKDALRKLNFQACAPAECTAEFAVDPKLIREISANKSVEATIVAVNGSRVKFTINPEGIEKAYQQIAD